MITPSLPAVCGLKYGVSGGSLYPSTSGSFLVSAEGRNMIRFAATFCLFRITAFAVPTLPLLFERNMGQAASEALYVARGQGYEIWSEARGVSLVQGANTIRMRLDGASPALQIRGRELQSGKAN